MVLNLYSTFIQVFYIVKRKPKSFPFLWIKTYFYDGFYIPLSIGQEVFSFSNLIKQVWKIQNHLITNVTQLLYQNLYRLSQMLNDAANFSFFYFFCYCENSSCASFTLSLLIKFEIHSFLFLFSVSHVSCSRLKVRVTTESSESGWE